MTGLFTEPNKGLPVPHDMKTISFLLFCLVAGVSLSQENPPQKTADYELCEQLEKIRSYAWKHYQLGNCGKALELYRRMRLLSPGNEEASSCYEEIAEKLGPDTANVEVRCEPKALEPLDKRVDSTILAAQKLLEVSSCRIGIREKADRLFDEGNYSAALECYKRCLLYVPSDTHVKNRIEDIYKKLRKVEINVLQLSFPYVLPVPVNTDAE